ncbi:MAG: DNA-binding response regulator [Methylococcales bacterium]
MLKKMRVIIVEDRELARDELKHLLSLHPDVEIVGEFEETASAQKIIETQAKQIDGVFLDIDIQSEGERAGLNLAYRIDRLDLPKKPWIVFTTGFKEHALEAHLVGPYGYLVKPLDDTKLTQVLDRIRREITKNQPQLSSRIEIKHKSVSRGETLWCTKYINPKEILYIQSNNNGNTVRVQLINGDVLDGVNRALKDWQVPGFMRIHKSHLVNLEHVNGHKPDAIKSECHNVTFRCSTIELAIGGNYLDDLRKALNNSYSTPIP